METTTRISVTLAPGDTTFSTKSVEYEKVMADDVPVIFVKFVAENGYQRGKVHRVPLAQVQSIVGGPS